MSDDAATVARPARIVLPGVGAAAPAMRALRALGLDAAIGEAVERGGSLLGVCLGMQLLFERSAEGGVDCLGLLPGRVERIGWARPAAAHGLERRRRMRRSSAGRGGRTVCYFAHSYRACRPTPAAVVADTELDGTRFASWSPPAASPAPSSTPRRAAPRDANCWRRWLEVPVAA